MITGNKYFVIPLGVATIVASWIFFGVTLTAHAEPTQAQVNAYNACTRTVTGETPSEKTSRCYNQYLKDGGQNAELDVSTPVTTVNKSGVESSNEGILGFLLNLGGGTVEGALGGLIGGFLWAAVFVTEIITRVTGLILFFAGGFFNIAVQEFTIGMGKYVTGSAAEGIRIAWTIIRDIANIGIIGGLVATAIGTILQNEKYSINKTLARLIIAALLVNFSYFFAGAIIDLSNYTAGVIYENVVAPANCLTDCTISERLGNAVKIEEVRNANLKNLGVSLFLGAGYLVDPLATAVTSAGAGAVAGALGELLPGVEADPEAFVSQAAAVLVSNLFFIIFEVTMTFVFLSMFALLIARFVVLILLLITSPIGIAGPAIPLLSKYSKEWWDALFSQAFFAPIFFLLAGISLTIIESLPTAKALAEGGVVGIGVSMIDISLNFFIAIVFMLVALQMARSMSAEAKRFEGIYKAAGRLDFSKPYGAWVARNTIGRASEAAYYAYNNRMMPLLDKITGDRFSGSGLDRVAKNFIESGRKFKPFEKQESHAEAKQAKLVRRAEADDFKQRAEKKKQVPGLTANYEKADKAYKARLEKGKELPPDSEKPLADKDGNYKNEDVETFNKKQDEKGGRRWVRDPATGKWDWENQYQFAERLRDTELDLGDGTKGTWRDAYTKLEGVLTDLPAGSIKEIHEQNPQLLVDMALAWTPEQVTELYGMKEVSRGIKDKIRLARHGDILTRAKDLEQKTFSETDIRKQLEGRGLTGSALEKGVETEIARREAGGEYLRYGKRWNDQKGYLHEYMKRYVPDEEIQDLIVSDVGRENGIQINGKENQSFWDALTHGNWTAMQKSNKMSSARKRATRGAKRARLTDALDLDDETGRIFDTYNKNEGEREALVKEVGTLVDDGTFIAELEKAEQAGDKEKVDLLVAARKRLLADRQAEGWFQGKAGSEVDGEIKQEHMGRRLVAKKIRVNQLNVLNKDQGFMDQLSNSIFKYGNEQGAEKWIIRSNSGQTKMTTTPPKAIAQEIDKARKERGEEPLYEEVSGSDAEAGGGDTVTVTKAQTVTEIVQRPLPRRGSRTWRIEVRETKQILDNTSPEEIANMEPQVFLDPRVAKSLDWIHLQAILDRDDIPPAIRNGIKGAVIKHGRPDVVSQMRRYESQTGR